ncbi:MAG: bifunctional phosphoserine phosphatase/homoserine phosphotransferase ThrH [Propionibacteriaceae bacterium]|nr:bifunctional phosphoserine phosphatase/homoserine phosphotransferase ThrH [Propionibacteriaceae bacterium]
MEVVCFDLEGVLVPEIWINVAEKTGIEALRLTTRDVPDYDELMVYRLGILEKEGLGIAEIQNVIAQLSPMPGAAQFLAWVKQNFQVIILSDTFYQFAAPLMTQLDYPALFAHNLIIDDRGRIVDYKLRMRDQKAAAVRALQELNFTVFAAGDSYNDTGMLLAADRGFLFRPPAKVIEEFPQLPVFTEYDALKAEFVSSSSRSIG